MKRGEIWTVAGGADFAGKPRPAVVIQGDQFAATASVTICLMTTDRRNADILRPDVVPSPSNGLRVPSQVMIDKITSIPRTKVGVRLGQLTDSDMATIEDSLLQFLGLITPR